MKAHTIPAVGGALLLVGVACGDSSSDTGGANAAVAATSTVSGSSSSAGDGGRNGDGGSGGGLGGGGAISSGEGGEGVGGGNGVGTGAGGEGGSACDTAEPPCAVCHAYREREETCEPGGETDECPDPASVEIACLIRPEALAPYLECLLDCELGEASCSELVGETIDPAPAQGGFLEACSDALDTCEGSFDSGYCGPGDHFHLILNDAIYEARTPCFALDCEEIEECLEDTLGREFEACEAAG